MVAAAAAGGHSGRRSLPFFFFPASECHLSVWPTNAPRWRPLPRLPGASRVPELGCFIFAPSHPLHPSPASSFSGPTPAHPPPPASEEAAFISFLNITFTPVWASGMRNSPSRTLGFQEPSEIQRRGHSLVIFSPNTLLILVETSTSSPRPVGPGITGVPYR